MDITEAIKKRHSVRQYTARPLGENIISALRQEISACNSESGLHIQLVTNEPKAFDGFMARYGKFNGVANYLAMVGKKDANLDEKCGYYGERIVLKAQQLGLNTCWVAVTYSKVKSAYSVEKGEKLCLVIALGYGEIQGIPHKSKSLAEISESGDNPPDWFKRGIEAALLAPTAMNQQKFKFILNGNSVTAKSSSGFCTKIDLGIVKYHFEVAAGTENFTWK